MPANAAQPFLYTNDSYDRVELCVQATPANAAESGIGVIFWATSYNSCYVFNVSDGKAWVSRLWNGGWLRPIPMWESGDIKRGVGQTNELRVALGDGQDTLYINDKKSGTLIGNPTMGPSWGLRTIGQGAIEFAVLGVRSLKAAACPKPSVLDPIFEYDFSTAPPEWASWQGVSVKDRELFVKPEAGQGFPLPVSLDAYGRGDLRVKVRVDKPEENAEPVAGLVFWYKADSYYRLDVLPISGKVGVTRWSGGRFLRPVELQESRPSKKGPEQ